MEKKNIKHLRKSEVEEEDLEVLHSFAFDNWTDVFEEVNLWTIVPIKT